MNKKIWFDLDNFELDVFNKQMNNVKISEGESYRADIYITSVSPKEVKEQSTIPFTLLDSDNRDELMKQLFGKIHLNVSYSGMSYEGSFYICIHKAQPVIVRNNILGVSTEFASRKEAAKWLNVTSSHVSTCIKVQKPCKGIYTITKKK